MNIKNLPNLGLGLGLRSQHFEHILKHRPSIDWFEIISENFIDDYGWGKHVLMEIRENYPIVMHGVSLSIGSCEPINYSYLSALKQLAEDVQPSWISDHLCWTGVQNMNTHDLLPVPLTEESLFHICKRITQVQEFLERPLILENPSTYLNFKTSNIPEWDFLNAMSKRTGCGLLIDVNNVYVSARNHGFDPLEYIDKLDHKNIVQTHLSGHTDLGDHCIDTHDQAVSHSVWKLYARLKSYTGDISTLLEWDANIPEFPVLHAEILKAKDIIEEDTTFTPYSATDQPALSNPIRFMAAESE